MKFRSLWLVVVLLVSVGLPAAARFDQVALVRISLRDWNDLALVQGRGLPIYAHLADAQGHFLLVGAGQQTIEALRADGLTISVLDADMRPTGYYLVSPAPGRAAPTWQDHGRLLDDDGMQAIVWMSAAQAAHLAGEGVLIAALPQEPIILSAPEPALAITAVMPNVWVADRIAQISQNTLYRYEEWLSGVTPAYVGGGEYTIQTRHSYSGAPIQKAAQFVYEHLQRLGLNVEYHTWSGATNPNVIATQVGLTRPNEIYIICAHLDDMPSGATAPGADDNASGVAGVLMAANILSQVDLAYTVKYALWTGEEQGLLGSQAWANWAYGQGMQIKGVINLDMIAYNSDSYPIIDLYAKSTVPGSTALANLFADVITAYQLNLTPNIFIDNSMGNYSDNKSFWNKGYSAILGIEDDDDFTPYYHTIYDRLPTLNMTYMTQFVRAAVAALLHLSMRPIGHLDGYVTAAVSSQPLRAAQIDLISPTGRAFFTAPLSNGYYTDTLPIGVYTVTVSCPGFVSLITQTTVLTNALTRLNLALSAVPDVTASPSSLDVVLSMADQTTRTLQLTNHSADDLAFKIGEFDLLSAQDLNWLAVQPLSGTVPAGKSLSLTLSLDAGALSPGAYHGGLGVQIGHASLLSIPVTLTVECDAVHILQVSRDVQGCAVTVTAALTGALPFVWSWDWGEWGVYTATTSTIQTGVSGTWPFTLTVSNCGGFCADVFTDTVMLECDASPRYWLYLPFVEANPCDLCR